MIWRRDDPDRATGDLPAAPGHGGSDERGATAVEYGLMVALIAAIIIGAVQALGGNVLEAFGIDF